MFTASGNINGKPSYECMMNKKPHLGFLRIFGCEAYVHITSKPRERKFEPRSKKGF